MKPSVYGLLLGVATPLVIGGAEFHISSIGQQPNGLKVAWTEAAPGYAYTLQECDSLTRGGWRDVWTRYRWPGVMTQWTLPEGVDVQGAARLYRVVAEPIRTPMRGRLLTDTLEELLASPYSQTLAPLLDGNHPATEVSEAIGPNVQSTLASGFRDALLNDANHPLRLAVAENSLIDWVPQAPMRLYHCAGDEVVPYDNSVMAQQAFADNGACCTALIDPGAPGLLTHDACWRPASVAAKEWFDTFRQ